MPDSFVFEQVADCVRNHANGLTRAEIAEMFGITKSTALSHLEKCVQRGLIRKSYTWTSNRKRGWVYYHTAPEEF